MATEIVPLTIADLDKLNEVIANAVSLADLLHSAGEVDANIPGKTIAQVCWQIRSQLYDIHELIENCSVEATP